MLKSWLIALGAGLVGGCGADDAPGQAAAPAPEVVSRTTDATAMQCAFGGKVVAAGLDLDGDGVLGDAEVQRETVLCEPGPASAIVVALAAEPPGPNCARGGTAVASGTDGNGNGVLDPDEVDHTDYVCGAALVSRMVAVAPGATCAAGGVATQLGPDRDGDGVLGDAEVIETQYACGGVLPGDAIVHTVGDVAALASVTEIGGTLVVAGLTDVALPKLAHVGAVTISDDAVTTVALPALRGIDGALTATASPKLTRIALPALVHAGSVEITLDPALTEVSLPVLTTVDGGLVITDNPALASVDVQAIDIGGPVRLSRDAQLATLALPRLQSAGALQIDANALLTEVSAPDLQLVAQDIDIRLDDQLTAIALGGGVGADALTIRDNAALTTLDLNIVTRGNAEIRATQPLALSAAPITREGALTLAGPISLPASPTLSTGGNCQLDGTQIGMIAANSHVGGDLALVNNPVLITIQGIAILGSLDVRNNAKLISLGLIPGAEVHGHLTIQDNPRLTITTILKGYTTRVHGDVLVRNNPSLTELFGPALSRVDGTVTLDLNPALVDPGLGGLAHADAIEIDHSDAMTTLALTALTSTSSITVRGNAGLTAMTMPALQTADLGVFDNPHLPTCAVTALFARLGGQHQQSGNDDTATCTPGGAP